MLDPDDRTLIESKTTEDRVLYVTLMKHLDTAGRSSMSGRALGA